MPLHILLQQPFFYKNTLLEARLAKSWNLAFFSIEKNVSGRTFSLRGGKRGEDFSPPKERESKFSLCQACRFATRFSPFSIPRKKLAVEAWPWCNARSFHVLGFFEPDFERRVRFKKRLAILYRDGVRVARALRHEYT